MNRKSLHALALVLLFSLPVSANNLTPEAKPPAAKRLIAELQDIVETLEADNPDFLETFSDSDKQKVLKAFILSFDGGIKLETDKKEPKGIETDKLYKAVELPKNHYLYTRVDSLTIESVKDVNNDLKEYIETKPNMMGCILDLRSCNGHNITRAIELVQAIRDAKENTPKMAITVLIGAKTSGSAEILAKIIDHEQLGMTIGTQTAGEPLPNRSIPLNSGDKIKLPQANKYMRVPDVKPLKPQLNITDSKQVSYDTLLALRNVENTDKCLSRAIDLMVSINIMK